MLAISLSYSIHFSSLHSTLIYILVICDTESVCNATIVSTTFMNILFIFDRDTANMCATQSSTIDKCIASDTEQSYCSIA